MPRTQDTGFPWLLTADWHVTPRAQDEYRWTVLAWVADRVGHYHVRNLFILGDLTDAKDCHSAWLIHRTVDQLRKIAEQGCSIYILKGNHDYIDPENPFFGFLSLMPNVQYIRWTTGPVQIGGVNVLFLPHGENTGVLRTEKYDIAFCHNIFSGAKIGGREIPPTASGIPDKPRHRIWSGDIHWPQRAGGVEYVGAPYPVVFGDTYTPRVVLMDSKLRPGDLTPPSPRKWILDLRAGDRVAAKLPKDCRGDHVRLRVRLKRREFDSWELIRDALRNEVQALGLELYGIEFLAAEEPKSISSGGKVATGRAISESPEELIHRYAKQQDVPEETLKAGMECLE